MEPAEDTDPRQIVATIDQKAVRLSALLRDIDNHPLQLDPDVRDRLDDILEMLDVRIQATRTLLHQDSGALAPR